jgi:hypothetical protein
MIHDLDAGLGCTRNYRIDNSAASVVWLDITISIKCGATIIGGTAKKIKRLKAG